MRNVMIVETAETALSGRDSGPREEEAMARTRDRVLLYTRGLGVEPFLSLDLALESLRRADARKKDLSSPDTAATPAPFSEASGASVADMERAMEALYGLLREKDICLGYVDTRGEPLRSAPPMNRRSMIAEEMDRSPLRRILKRLESLTRPGKEESASPRP